MPRGNGTGPMGAGPMTGRGMGLCAGYTTPGYAHNGRGPGFGMGRGCGGGRRGFRNIFNAAGLSGWARSFFNNDNIDLSPEAEKKILVNQSEMLKQQLDAVNRRLEEMDSGK